MKLFEKKDMAWKKRKKRSITVDQEYVTVNNEFNK